MRHLVAISDIHLSEIEPTDGLWMRYRQKPYTPGAQIAEMLDDLLARVRGDDLTLVLNGDVFDFDAPRSAGDRSEPHDLPRTEENCAPVVRAILRDHPELVRALARVIGEGHTLVFVSGNHDAQMTLPGVRDAVRDILVREARALGSARPGDASGDIPSPDCHSSDSHSSNSQSPDCQSPDTRSSDCQPADGRTPDGRPAGDDPAARALSERILFRAWFHLDRAGVVFEHGHQYDTFCSFRYPMAPFGKTPGVIQPTMGSMLARLYLGKLGYFNPHVDATFMLTLGGHLRHWARYYLFTRRSQAWIWASGALKTLHALLANRDPGSRERRLANIAEAARETGASPRSIARHARLFAPPGEDALWLVARELWVDRALFAAAGAGFVAAWALSQRHSFGLLASLGPVAMFAVELTQPKGTLEDNWRKVQRRARLVAKAHRARAVVFGHTHMPEGHWEDGVFYGNTGSWSAAYKDVACKEPLFEERPLVWLRVDAEDEKPAVLSGGLCLWKKGVFRFTSPQQTPSRVW